eukprot:TRINITY_DN5179_c0_g1_i1.p1 TRINITY_DN5179_c0_g1~~TRINITY_DN5179_c0_g1_i1.p1  ORF type:complete len:1046 (+),score=320.52 TRINITY_DN5179_c0_g1_i1:40-3138(+)
MPVLHVHLSDSGLLGGAGGPLSFACWLSPASTVAALLEEAVRRVAGGGGPPAALDIGGVRLGIERGTGAKTAAIALDAALSDTVGTTGLQSGDVVRIEQAPGSPPGSPSPWRRRPILTTDPSPPPSPPPTPPSLRMDSGRPPSAPGHRSSSMRQKRRQSTAGSQLRRGRSAPPSRRSGRHLSTAVATVSVKVAEAQTQPFSSVRFVLGVARRLGIDPAAVDVHSVTQDRVDKFGFSTGPAARGEQNRKFKFVNPKWDKPRFTSTPQWTNRTSPFSHELRRWIVEMRFSEDLAAELAEACRADGDSIHSAVPGIVGCCSSTDAVPEQKEQQRSSSPRITSELSVAPPRPRRRKSGFYAFVRAEVKMRAWQDNNQTKAVAAEARCQWKTYFLFPALDADTTTPWSMSSDLQGARRLRECLKRPPVKLFATWDVPIPHCWEGWTGMTSPKRDGGPLYGAIAEPLVRVEPLWLSTDEPREDERQMQLNIHASWYCSKKKPREGCGRWNPLRAGKCWCDRPRPKEVTEYAKKRCQEEENGGPGGSRIPWRNLVTGALDTEERFPDEAAVARKVRLPAELGVAELTAKFAAPETWDLKETMKRLNGRKLAVDYLEQREKVEAKEERRRARLFATAASGRAKVADAQERWELLEGRYRGLLHERLKVGDAEALARRDVELWEESAGAMLGKILRLMDMETAWRLGLWLHWEEYTPREWLKWLGILLIDQEEGEKRPRIRQEEEEAWQKMHSGDTGPQKKVYKRLVPEPAAGKKCCIVPPDRQEMGPQPGVISEITPASVRVEFVDKRELGRQDIKFEYYEGEQRKYEEEEAAREKAGGGEEDLDEDAKLALKDARRAVRLKRERALILAYEILPMVPYWRGWSFVGLQDQEGNIIADRAVQRFGVEEVAVRALRHGLVRDTKREKQSVKVFPTHGRFIIDDPTVVSRFEGIEEAVRAHARERNHWREIGAPPPEPAQEEESDAGDPDPLPSPRQRSRRRPSEAAGSFASAPAPPWGDGRSASGWSFRRRKPSRASVLPG